MMARYKLAFLFALAAILSYPIWQVNRQAGSKRTGSSSGIAHAAEVAPTPGQLTILDKEGKPAGLCPLKHTEVTADIAGYVARVTVQQEFHNPTDEAIEAVYTFPLPHDAAVDEMTMRVGERVIKGQIMRREEAREVYEAAKAAGQVAALLDQERPNIFTQSVANIMPGEQVMITIRYVHLLKYEEGYYEFVFPMVVGPRYTPGGGYTVPGKRGEPSPQQKIEGDPGAQSVVTDADKITPPITPPNTRAGHNISLTVNVDAGLPIREIHSVLHEVKIQRHGSNRATLSLKRKQEIPNKDFILRYTAAGSHLQTGILTYARGDGSGYFTLIIQPPLAPPRSQISPKEMVFVIDQTGSQAGWPIAKAKETMRYCIQNMNPGDTFQLIAFNTEVYPCFPAPVPNTPKNVQKALAFLEPLEGSGGTDILKSVDYALKMPDDPGRLRIICYMTDGYVGNDMQIIDYIGKHRGRARMFPFGVGNAVNRFLIDGMAREGRGAAEYVTLNTPGKEAAARFYRRIADPILLDPQVEWNGLPVVEIYPTYIPDVFSAGPIILKGRYTKPAEGEIVVRGILRGRPWSQRLHVVLPAVDKDGSAIATLWAREKIEALQSQDWLGAQTGNPKPELKEQIIATALEYRLMSQYTSFVAVEEKVVNVNGQPRKVDVPVEMPEGVSYEGIFGEGEQPVLGGGFGGNCRTVHLSWPAGRSTGVEAKVAKEVVGQTEAPGGFRMDASAVLEGTEKGQEWLATLKPKERRALLIQLKLAPALQEQLEQLRQKPQAGSKKIEVQLVLNSLSKEDRSKLEALGFEVIAELKPGKLLLGTIRLDKLEALLELPFVRRVAPARFK